MNNINFSGKEYTPGEIQYVIESLGEFKSISQIQESFLSFTENQKSLPGSVIQQIQLKYKDRIKKHNDLYLNNIATNPIYHPKVRLDILNRVIEDSMKPRPSHVIKRGDGDFEIIEKPDYTTVINALKLVMQDLNEREKLDREKEKLEPQDTENNTWNIDTGISNLGG